MPVKSCRLTISGLVQGVGFRPYIYRLAKAFSLNGCVYNSSRGVTVIVQGDPGAVREFIDELPRQKPDISRIEHLNLEEIPYQHYSDFSIQQSVHEKENDIYISPDLSTCTQCRDDISDPGNRRFGYAFTTCTYCGPRYTIIDDIPYDRAKTTMREFQMCPDCATEYTDPGNRRYHSQPNACPVCGPVLQLFSPRDGLLTVPDPLGELASQLKAGIIGAIKGLGGFLLCCDAHNDQAVRELRRRKHREAKPLAVMARDLEIVRQYCQLTAPEAALLSAPQKPIVLLVRKPDCHIADQVAPGLSRLGMMLPYTPMHIQLMQELPLLVMTSANLSEEPILADNDAAFVELAGIADYILLHDRRIANRIDDSVLQVQQDKTQAIRRGRGFVPGSLHRSGLQKTILAVGGELKNVFALNRGETIFVGPHIGDLKTRGTYDFFRDSLAEWQRKFGLYPVAVACDRHPQYLSSQWAAQSGLPRVQVFHHHAHLVSCMVEHGLTGPVIGFAMDGTGYGEDGHSWGCEAGIVNVKRFSRQSHLDYFQLPGADKCTDQIFRTAVSLLYQTFGEVERARFPFLSDIDPNSLAVLLQMLEKRLHSPLTSSMGRLFDGVAALLGLGSHATYEASAAIQLEAIADPTETGVYPVILLEKAEMFCWSVAELIRHIVQDMEKGFPASIISARFHNSVVNYMKLVALMLRSRTGLNQVVLSGGVFLNSRLSCCVEKTLAEQNFEVFVQREFPPGDGGLAIGQLVIANEVI